ncbi:MAG TPA: hypothetical protein DCY07_04165 [Rhodospirillaceae bacterium]|nr:hypothetical protein [Rhodospirillaceae bacterium]
MSITIDVGNIIAAIALLFSGYATWKTSRFNERQKALIESQEKLNQLLLEKEAKEAASDKKADIGASFIKLGNSKYRLKIWNKGNADARNIRIEFPEGNDIVNQSEVDAKFPLETLDTYQSVELVASVHMQTKGKHTIRLTWSDDFSQQNEKVVYPTI